MDTSSYLRSQGWLGTGHALNSHKPGLGLEAGQRAPGLSKPLTIPQKQNVFGVGKKTHDSHADQWWARAFDDVLKGVNARPEGPTTPGAELVVEPPRTNMTSMKMGGLGKHGNLYGSFVRGEGLRGTFLKAEEEEEAVVVVRSDDVASIQADRGKKRRRRQDGVDEDASAVKKICKEELATGGNRRGIPLHASKVIVQDSISMTSQGAAGSRREHRRRQRQQQEARKAKELADAQYATKIAVKEPIRVNGDSKETKEQRRQRRQERKERKVADAIGAQKPSNSTMEEPVNLSEEGTETKEQRKQRREERRARKAATTAERHIALKSPVEEPVITKEKDPGTKEEKLQRREERRAKKATKEAQVAVHQVVVSAMPMKGLEKGKASKVAPDGRADNGLAMANESGTVGLKRKKNARNGKKKKKRGQKVLLDV